MSGQKPGVLVTALDLENGDKSEHTVMDDYVLVDVGTARVDSVNVYRKADGTETHVITVKGVKRRG